MKVQYVYLVGNALLLMYIYKESPVKKSTNIAFLSYKEIYMKYLMLYYKGYNICLRYNIRIRYKMLH